MRVQWMILSVCGLLLFQACASSQVGEVEVASLMTYTAEDGWIHAAGSARNRGPGMSVPLLEITVWDAAGQALAQTKSWRATERPIPPGREATFDGQVFRLERPERVTRVSFRVVGSMSH